MLYEKARVMLEKADLVLYGEEEAGARKERLKKQEYMFGESLALAPLAETFRMAPMTCGSSGKMLRSVAISCMSLQFGSVDIRLRGFVAFALFINLQAR